MSSKLNSNVNIKVHNIRNSKVYNKAHIKVHSANHSELKNALYTFYSLLSKVCSEAKSKLNTWEYGKANNKVNSLVTTKYVDK